MIKSHIKYTKRATNTKDDKTTNEGLLDRHDADILFDKYRHCGSAAIEQFSLESYYAVLNQSSVTGRSAQPSMTINRIFGRHSRRAAAILLHSQVYLSIGSPALRPPF